MIERLLVDRPEGADARVSLLVNSLGATPLEELFILFRRARQTLAKSGIEVVKPLVGHYATSMEMAGASFSLHFLDKELEALLAAPCDCPFWKVSA
jgi:dihydroxyacetone kinase-like protein